MVMPIAKITVRAGDKHYQIAAETGVAAYLTKPSLEANLLAHAKTFCAAVADTLAL